MWLWRAVILIGPMGAGKTTIGRLLAARLHCSFVDMDEAIVARAGKTIPEIFEEDGERIFRALEAEVLETLCRDPQGKVIATGGGAVLSATNRERMRAAGPVIWLDVKPEAAAERIAGDANRPLLHGVDPLAKARELDRIRRPLYEQASDFRVATDEMSPEQAVEAILKFLHSQ